jgi:hypothetical protein
MTTAQTGLISAAEELALERGLVAPAVKTAADPTRLEDAAMSLAEAEGYAPAVLAPPQPKLPSFTPTRVLTIAKTWADVQKALATLAPGDRLPCQGVVGPPEATISKSLSGAAEVTFDAACKFQGGAGKYLPAIWFKHIDRLRFLFDPACEITNPLDGPGILWSGGSGGVYDGFNVAKCGTHATAAMPTTAHFDGNFMRGTVADWSLVPDLDNHPEKGTGLHGMLTSDANAGYVFRNNTVVLSTTGSALGGSLLEIGDSDAKLTPYGNKLWLDAMNLLQDAKTQTAGNALNLWDYVGSLDVLWIGAKNLHGKAVMAGSGTFAGIKIDAGHAVGCCQNPNQKLGSPWGTAPGIAYTANVS